MMTEQVEIWLPVGGTALGLAVRASESVRQGGERTRSCRRSKEGLPRRETAQRKLSHGATTNS